MMLIIRFGFTRFRAVPTNRSMTTTKQISPNTRQALALAEGGMCVIPTSLVSLYHDRPGSGESQFSNPRKM